MDRLPASPSTPTPDPDSTVALCTPRPTNKRATTHIATPDLDHQAKKLKMGHRAEENSASDIATMVHRPQLGEGTYGDKLDCQSSQASIIPQVSTTPPDQDLESLVAGYEEDLASLRAQMADLKAKMRDLEAQIPIKDKKLHDLKEFIAIQHLQPPTVTLQGPDDSLVTSKFSALRYAIINLTMVELHGSPFLKQTKTDQKNLFSHMTRAEEDYKQYLGDSAFKSFFFEGVIWTVLINRLLCCPLTAFQHVEEGVIRDQIYNHGGASVQKFHAWRAYTADFLEDAFGPRAPWRPGGALRSQLISELVDLLSRYSASCKKVEVLTQQLDDIVDKAVNLAWLMAKSRAYWVCIIPTCPETKLPHGFVFIKEFMKVKTYLEGGRRGVVDLVGRPSLLKYGDSNGEQYDTHVVFEKAEVLAFEGNKPKKADANYVAR